MSFSGQHPDEGQKSCMYNNETRQHGTVWGVAAMDSHVLHDNQCTECSCIVRYSLILSAFVEIAQLIPCFAGNNFKSVICEMSKRHISLLKVEAESRPTQLKESQEIL